MSATDQSSLALSQSKIYNWIQSGSMSASTESGATDRITRSMSSDPPERNNQVSNKIRKAKNKSQRKSKGKKNASRNLSGESSASTHSDDQTSSQSSSSPPPSPSRSLDTMLNDALGPTQSDSNTPTPSPETELARYKIYTEYLETQIESFKTERDILNGELKIMNTLKKKVKKLTQENDTLLRNASKKSGTRRFTDVSSVPSQTDPPLSTQEADNIATAKLNSMRDHITKVAQDLLSAASSLTASTTSHTPSTTSSSAIPPTPQPTLQQDSHTDEPFQIARNRRQRRAPDTDRHQPAPAPPSYAHVASSQRRRPGQGSRFRNQKKIIIVGSSLTDGISAELKSHNVDSTTHIYRGGKIDLIRDRVPHIFSKDTTKQPDKIFVLAGGNDAEETTTDRTINGYEGLIRDIRTACPRSKILISSIPPRKNDRVINSRIKEVNEYLADRGQRKDNVQFVDVVPVESDLFTAKKVHFTQKGKSLLASRLTPFLID